MKWRDLNEPGDMLQRRFGFDEAEGAAIIKSWQPNIEDCLALNQAFLLAERSSTLLAPGDTWVRVASVPLWLIEKWRNEEGLDYFNPDHQPTLIARLNSNEYERLRTAPGRL